MQRKTKINFLLILFAYVSVMFMFIFSFENILALLFALHAYYAILLLTVFNRMYMHR